MPVLAHPGATRAEWVIPEEDVAELVAAGLFGIEVDHPENTAGGGRVAAGLAAGFGLPITGSSDYHGAGKPNRLGDAHDGSGGRRRDHRQATARPVLP